MSFLDLFLFYGWNIVHDYLSYNDGQIYLPLLYSEQVVIYFDILRPCSCDIGNRGEDQGQCNGLYGVLGGVEIFISVGRRQAEKFGTLKFQSFLETSSNDMVLDQHDFRYRLI